ncbi:DUF6538 domain-containing protein [Methylobacterium gnaphalii]|uniref:Core-binding (CB) domain-containing protein n=1 Tax=Methylobacterium gnaphalii TaxID=1010610 RepID=A0A512JMP7_9HYPH|nr:DUF6538 domain-containing protein [Methylobacterium gnaphalii]GEP11246.1 hypothetical protein MGN01_30910 [Methylobacterium gnaphalii]GJD70115.1 Tyrosine recombinase XerC [Methylobacterium gnaphalii]GLS49750.1 hypothetical protein GCM10007885_26000 [Methylobacterium gnaphalii]
MKRSGSSVHQLVQRIPTDVLEKARGRRLAVPIGDETATFVISERAVDVRISLKTRDPAEARARQSKAGSYLQDVWRALRASGPIVLTHQQATALAGDLYRAWADASADRTIAITHTPAGWVPDRCTPEEERAGFEAAANKLCADIEAGEAADIEPTLGPLIDPLLLRKGIDRVDADSRAMLLDAFARSLRDAFRRRQRQAEGDYTAHPTDNRHPEWTQPKSPEPASRLSASTKTSLTGLVAAWWAERKAAGLKPSTHESYWNTMANFVAFLKHDDAARVTAANVIAFKDHRLATINPRSGKPISAKTVKENDIAGLRTIFAWAVANQRMASNPVKEVTLKLGKPKKLRSKGFTDEEARAILEAASAYQGGTERPQTTAAKR